MNGGRSARCILALIVISSGWFTASIEAQQYPCFFENFTIRTSPTPNPPGSTFPNGFTAQAHWYQIAGGSSSTITIIFDPCTTSFPASATSMRYTLVMGNGIVGTTPVVPRTSPDSFAEAMMTISVPANPTLANTSTGGHIRAEAFNASNQTVALRNFQLDVFVTGAAASFTPVVNPSSINVIAGDATGATFQASIAPDSGFTAPVRVFLGNAPVGITVTPSEQTLNPPYSPVPFTVRATSGTPPQQNSEITMHFSSGGVTKNGIVRVNVLPAGPPPDFTFTVSQSRSSFAQNDSTIVTVTATGSNGFQGPINFTSNHDPTRLDVIPFTMNVPLNGTVTQTLTVRALSTAAVGPANFILTGTSGTLQRTAPIVITIIAAAQPDFSFSASSPNPPVIVAGEVTRVTVAMTPAGGFNSSVNVTTQLPPGITAGIADQSFVLTTAAPSRQVTLTSLADAAGARTVSFIATSGTIQRTAVATFTVTPRAAGTVPIIDGVSPELTAPTRAQVIYLVGRNFANGATVTSLTPGVVVERTVVRSSNLAEVAVTVQAGVAPRAYRVDLRNPDGASTVNGGHLIIRRHDDLGAALGVTTAAILEPRQGQIVANGQQVYAVGHLATSGTGTVQGHWSLDGVPFDVFSATVAGGRLVTSVGRCPQSEGGPAQICAQVPIPPLTWGPAHRLELVIEKPGKAVSPAVLVIGAPDSASRMTVYEPVDGIELADGAPLFRWTLIPGAGAYELEFQSTVNVAPKPRVVFFRTTETRLLMTRRDLLRLGAGTYRWRVRAIRPGDVRADTTPWLTITLRQSLITQRVAQIASAAGVNELVLSSQDSTASGATAPDAKATDYAIAPNVTLTSEKEGEAASETSVRAQFSTQGELARTATRSQFTGDLSWEGSRDPNRFVQESRNWVIMAGTPVERSGGDVRFGYTSADFADGTEYLTSGLARLGVIARVRTKAGTLSYFQPADVPIPGVLSGNPKKVDVQSLAFSTPDGRPYILRLIGLEVTEPVDTVLGTLGTRLRTYGLFGRYDLNPSLALVGEVASGQVRDLGIGTRSRSGLGLRFGATGVARGFTYSAVVRNVSAHFVNPANRGLTPGGVSDRLSTDLSVSRAFGRVSLMALVTRQMQGRSGDSTLPEADQTTVQLGLSTMLGPVSVNLSANSTGDRGDADLSTSMPGTDRRQTGLTATFSEMVGRLSFSQTLSLQRLDDQIDAFGSKDDDNLSFSVTGALRENVTLMASLSGTRTEAVPALGTTNSWTVALQPSIALPFARLALQPSISYNRSKNEDLRTETKGENYQAIVQWSPSALGSVVAAQGSVSWNRNGSDGTASSDSLMRSYAASVTMQLNKKRGMPLFAPSTPLPGSTPPQPPVSAPASAGN